MSISKDLSYKTHILARVSVRVWVCVCPCMYKTYLCEVLFGQKLFHLLFILYKLCFLFLV